MSWATRYKTGWRCINLAISVVLALTLLQHTYAAKEGVKEANWQPLCKLGLNLRKAPKLARHHIQSFKPAIHEADKLASKLLTYALNAPWTNETLAITAAAAALMDVMQTELDRLVNYADKAAGAIATTSALRGEIEELLTVLDTGHSNSATSFCLGNAGATSAWSGKVNGENCITQNWEHDADGTVIPGTELTPAGFNVAAVPNLIETGGGKTATMCGYFQSGNVGTTAHAKTSNVKLAGGIWVQGANDNVAQQNLQALTPAGTRTATELTAAAHFDMYFLNTEKPLNLPTSEESLLKDSSVQAATKAIVKNILKLKDPEITAAAQEAQSTKIIKDYLDSAGTKIKDLLAKIDNEDTTDVEAKPQPRRKFSTITKTTKAHETLVYAVVNTRALLAEANARADELTAAAKLTGNKKQDHVKSAEQTCNELKEKSDCDTNNKCTYDKTKENGKKCTLRNEEKEKLEKESQETGKDGKTNTNTTGSNSFVVKKNASFACIFAYMMKLLTVIGKGFLILFIKIWYYEEFLNLIAFDIF
uniref:Variant surface glycoprotein 1125.4047 n=1 Tax=Trypanosoma brucei TaxID=5691 RepID=A0A1J0R9V3_9TRYP|nr:variant surface glycoprotein 1125.4047 [Trypanosoma brucei]